MSATSASGSNPFATRFIKPGAVPFLFPPGVSAEQLVDKLRGLQWRAEIVAPHGSGKSSLLCALEPHFKTAGRHVIRVTLHNGETKLPADLATWQSWSAATLIIVDGYEQLSWWSRRRLAWRCGLRGAGCVVTSHASIGFPALLHLENNADLAERVVRRLGVTADMLRREVIEQTYCECGGNIREMLFRLYDLYERRNRF